MWTINVPAGNSSSGIIPSPHSPLLCCASDRPNRASTPISSTLMPAFRFLDDVRTHYETEIVDIPQELALYETEIVDMLQVFILSEL